jgi:hypothetical protein
MDYKLLELLRLYGQADFHPSLSKQHVANLIKDRLREKGVAYGEEELNDEFVKLLNIFREY